MATRSLGSLTLDLVAKTGGFEQGMDRATRSMQRFKADAQKQQDDLEKLLGKIDPVVARLDELDKLEQQLAAHRKANRLPADDYAEYLGKLNAMRDGLAGATSANDKYTMSAKAQAAALRGVPAQFTDIVVSLQAGQQPLQVLLQQGGQLKDMFGGIGPAARALGGYITGMINPFTLLAAAAAVLALAYKQGSAEQDAFRVSLVSTGNLAGKNTGQMADLAKEVSGVTGTTGAAADALAQLVATGSLTSDQFKDMAVAAVAWESATGKAVSETVAEFKRLADEPTKASAALNEQYNYLTAAVYDQIRALEEQGGKTAAANLAETTYASALQERAKNIKENLGSLESAWNSVTSGAKRAWDAMLNIGREDTLAQQIEKAQKQLDELPARSALTGRQAARDQAAQDAQRAALQGQLDFLKQQKATQDSIAQAQGLAAEDERAAIAASTAMHQKYLAGLDNEAKKKNAIAELDRERAARLRVTGADAAAIEREYAGALAGIEEKFKDKKKTPRAKAYSDDEATRTLLALRQQQSSLEEQLSSSEKLTASQQKRAQFEQQIADLKTKQTLTADQQSLLASQDQIKAQLQKNAAIEQEIVHKQELQKLTERAAQLDASIASTLASQAEQYGRQLDGAGLGDQYRERLNQQKSIYREFQQYQEQLDKATPKDLLGSDQYNEAADKIRAGQEKALKQSRDYYAELDRQSGDWSLGAQDAYQNYLASARDVAGQTKSLFTNAFSSMEDAIVSFAMTGKLSFADFAKSVLADMAKIAVRSASSQALSGLLSVAGQVAASYFGGGTAPTSTTASVGGSTTTFNPQLNTAGLSYNGKGGVYDSPSLSAYSNQVHSTPKLFAFAKGAGVFGEAGPEAIMPLTRAADGSLGVRALSSSQNTLPTAAAPIMIKTDVHVDAGGNATSTTDESQAGDAGKQLGKMISDGALRVVQQQLATGGSIWRLVNGR